MPDAGRSASLDLLQDHIDLARLPFTDRGSRILVFREPGSSRLFVRLAERVSGLETGTKDFVDRPPQVRDICVLDSAGHPLDFVSKRSAESIELDTSIGVFSIVFQDAAVMAFGLPPLTAAGLRLTVAAGTSAEMYRAADQRAGDVSWTSNGEFERQEVLTGRDGTTVSLLVKAGRDRAISLAIGNPDRIQPMPQPFSALRAAADARWRDWFARVPQVAELYKRAYALAWWTLAANTVSPTGSITYEAVMPSKMTYVGIWLWDCAFHALALRHVDPELARNQIRVMLACQRPSGMLPDAIDDGGAVFEIDHPFPAEVTKPPLLAWAALKVHAAAPNLDFLKEIYEPLGRLNSWWLKLNDDDGDGVAQYNHPYSSGLDNSPLWDFGMPVESPDLGTYLCIEMDALATIAAILGRNGQAHAWEVRAAAVAACMIRDLWDERTGLFRALYQEKAVPVVTPFNLLPILTGRLPARHEARLIDHLTDPAQFWWEYGLPTVAGDDPHYDPQSMWRGPTWANVNYLFIEALDRTGHGDLARRLRERTLRLILADPEISEYYNAQTGVPAPNAARMFSWTASVFIDLALAATHDSARSDAQ